MSITHLQKHPQTKKAIYAHIPPLVRVLELAKRLNQEHPEARMQPTGVLLHGAPGTGKSITAAMLALLLRTCGVYSMNSSDEFEDGIEHAGVVIVDELMTKRGGESTDLERMLRMISSVPYRPNFAKLELKSNLSFFTLVIATTNADFTNLNTPYYTQAIVRRFPIKVNFDSNTIHYDGQIIDLTSISLLQTILKDQNMRYSWQNKFIHNFSF